MRCTKQVLFDACHNNYYLQVIKLSPASIVSGFLGLKTNTNTTFGTANNVSVFIEVSWVVKITELLLCTVGSL